jgi:hypothetical protein
MKIEKTPNGLAVIPFRDQNFVACTLQESHSSGRSITFGAESIGLKKFAPGEGWKDVNLDVSASDHYDANTKMHLTREQVKSLLPHLEQFVRTGELALNGSD